MTRRKGKAGYSWDKDRDMGTYCHCSCIVVFDVVFLDIEEVSVETSGLANYTLVSLQKSEDICCISHLLGDNFSVKSVFNVVFSFVFFFCAVMY